MRYVLVFFGLMFTGGGIKKALGLDNAWAIYDNLTPGNLVIPGLVMLAIAGFLFWWKSQHGSGSWYDQDHTSPDQDSRGPDDMDGGF